MADDTDERILGTDGDETIDAQGGSDTVFADAGDDTISGGARRDILRGGSGNDVIRGNEDGDILLGDSGDDTIYGGTGNDLILGGTGNDTLYGDEGDDSLTGGTGSGTFLFNCQLRGQHDHGLRQGQRHDRSESAAGGDRVFRPDVHRLDRRHRHLVSEMWSSTSSATSIETVVAAMMQWSSLDRSIADIDMRWSYLTIMVVEAHCRDGASRRTSSSNSHGTDGTTVPKSS